MKKNPMNYIFEIFGKHIDSDRLTQLTYAYPESDNHLMVNGDRELILECTIDLYNSIYEDDPNKITNYVIRTEPDFCNNSKLWLLVSKFSQIKNEG